MVILYSTNCPKCKVIETKLKQANIEFTLVEDKEKVIALGNEQNIHSAPILEIDGNFYDFAGAVNYIKGVR